MDRQKVLTVYAGRAGDRNTRAMAGAVELGTEIANKYGARLNLVGSEGSVLSGAWQTQLREALPDLRALAEDLAHRLHAREPLVTTMGRCAASIATLPVIARHHPDAAIVWLDAHGDCNAPTGPLYSASGYLGGMVLSGAAGEWNTGLGNGLDLSRVVLVGGRDLDPPEWERIRAGRPRLVDAGEHLAQRLVASIGDRPIYVHLDCDVLEPGLLPTEYQVPGGLSYENLEEACSALSSLTLVGLEISEFEAGWPNGQKADPDSLIRAISPLLETLLRPATGRQN
jgi:arginase